MADGLESLTAMRTKTTSRRSLPPPRHQPRQTPVAMPPSERPQPPNAPANPGMAAAAAPDTPITPSPPVAASARPQTPPPSTDLAKVSIYLDEHTDAYLETVRTAARSVKPRVDATRSAVVRLALNRLAEQLRPSDVVAELQRSASTHTGPGRKRA